MTRKTHTPTPDTDDPVAAAEGALKDPDAPTQEAEHVEFMTEAAVVSGSLGPDERPAALVVDDVRYTFLAEIGEYANDDGDMLDLKSKGAIKALLAWKRTREQLAAIQAAAAERENAGPDDVHLFHVERAEEFGQFEAGRRWVLADELSPGPDGNEGVSIQHGVVIRFAPEADEDGRKLSASEAKNHVRLLHMRISHIGDDGVVSLEPGERLRDHAIVFYPKPYVHDWVHLMAAVERTTADRFVNKMVHQAYSISDVRTGQSAGSGIAGKVGANTDLQHDLDAGRKARTGG